MQMLKDVSVFFLFLIIWHPPLDMQANFIDGKQSRNILVSGMMINMLIFVSTFELHIHANII